MNEISIVWFLFGFLCGEIAVMLILLSTLHRKWYGSYIVKIKNLPFSKKLKANLGLDDDFIL